MAQIVAGIKLQPSWERIGVEEKSANEYNLTLTYKPKVLISSISTPTADTKQIARAVLAALVKQGRKPSEERLKLDVVARQATRGETGKELVRLFGFTSYDYHTDQLEFTRMGK
jgi:putative heme iron utilization protein